MNETYITCNITKNSKNHICITKKLFQSWWRCRCHNKIQEWQMSDCKDMSMSKWIFLIICHVTVIQCFFFAAVLLLFITTHFGSSYRNISEILFSCEFVQCSSVLLFPTESGRNCKYDKLVTDCLIMLLLYPKLSNSIIVFLF